MAANVLPERRLFVTPSGSRAVCAPHRSGFDGCVFPLLRYEAAVPLSVRSAVDAQWAEVDVDVPLEFAWTLWEDREAIPKFMPWIAEVKVQEEDEKLSTWKLETEQFNRKWTLTWLAYNMAPIKNQKIHWRSVDGSTKGAGGIEVPNRGEIRFARRGDDSCNVRLSISYEVPDPLTPFVSALNPLVENILKTDMQRFKKYAAQKLEASKASA